MNKWKLAFFVCLSILVASNVFLAVILIDSGISYSYLLASYDSEQAANKTLGNLVLKGGQNYSQKEFLHLLRQADPDAFIIDEGDRIFSGPVVFDFQEGKLVKVN